MIFSIIYLNGDVIGESYENDNYTIPTGKYKGVMRYNSGKKFVEGPLGMLSKKGDFLLEVYGVKGRTDILLHQGNKAHHSLGCILLGPVDVGYSGKEFSFIGANHPLRKLRMAFYETEEPISCPDKEITITISENYVKKYEFIGNSPVVYYGGGRCSWSMQMQNIIFTATFDGYNHGQTHASLSHDEVEKTTSGDCRAITFRDNYIRDYINDDYIPGHRIEMQFKPSTSNNQKCIVEFKGTLGKGNISGNITWYRGDQPAPLDYKITMPITLIQK